MRMFELHRDEDEGRVSGVGIVAQGVVFEDGTTVLRWTTPHAPRSTAVYQSLEDCESIHGHGGRTRIVFK